MQPALQPASPGHPHRVLAAAAVPVLRRRPTAGGVPRTLVAAALLALLPWVAGCQGAAGGQAAPAPAPASPAEAGKLHFYQASVQPVLQKNCLRCHAGMNRRGGLDMSTRARLLQGGKDGAVVLPGRPDDSLLLRVIGPAMLPDDPMRMPPKGTRLTAEEVAAIRKWVADGAVMDR